MGRLKLDKEEQEILEAFDQGELKSVMTPARKAAAQAAAETLKKDKRINIRISSRDLVALQRRAALPNLGRQYSA